MPYLKTFITWILKWLPLSIFSIINLILFVFSFVWFFDEFEWEGTLFSKIFFVNELFIMGSFLFFGLIFFIFIFLCIDKDFKKAMAYTMILIFFNIMIIATNIYYRIELGKTFEAWQKTQVQSINKK